VMDLSQRITQSKATTEDLFQSLGSILETRDSIASARIHLQALLQQMDALEDILVANNLQYLAEIPHDTSSQPRGEMEGESIRLEETKKKQMTDNLQLCKRRLDKVVVLH